MSPMGCGDGLWCVHVGFPTLVDGLSCICIVYV